MSNWFEDNPTKSVIGYTMVVAAFTWAVSTFILQENRVNLIKAELDSQKAVTEQYKSKVELLQREMDAVRSENSEYRAWASQTKDAIPAIIPRINELKAKISDLERISSATPPPSKYKTTSQFQVKRGKAFVDSETGLVVTVVKVDAKNNASIIVKLPGQSAAKEQEFYPGWQWNFKANNSAFTLTLIETEFLLDSITMQISPAR